MSVLRLVLLLSFVTLTCGYGSAQTSASVVKLRPALSVDKVKQGSSFQVAFVLDIERGYHINSNRPADQFLIATSLKLERVKGLIFGPVVYPKALMKRFEFSEKPMSVYEGRVVLRVSARVLPTLAVGSQTIRGKLTVQACNDQACLQPKTVDVAVGFEVVPPATVVSSINGELFPTSGRRKQ